MRTGLSKSSRQLLFFLVFASVLQFPIMARAEEDGEPHCLICSNREMAPRNWNLDGFVSLQRPEPAAFGHGMGTSFFVFLQEHSRTMVAVNTPGSIPLFCNDSGTQTSIYGWWGPGKPKEMTAVDDHVDQNARRDVHVSVIRDHNHIDGCSNNCEDVCLTDELRIDEVSDGTNQTYSCWRTTKGQLELSAEANLNSNRLAVEYSVPYLNSSTRFDAICQDRSTYPLIGLDDFRSNTVGAEVLPWSEKLFLYFASFRELCWWPKPYVPMITVKMTRSADGGRRFESWLGLVRHGTSFEVDRQGRMTLVENWFDGEPHGVWLAVDWDKSEAWIARFVLGVRIRVAAGALSDVNL